MHSPNILRPVEPFYFFLVSSSMNGLIESTIEQTTETMPLARKVDTQEGTSPYNKSHGQVPSCELAIFAS